MKVVIAPDSFKESMSAKEAADAIERGLKKVIPDAKCHKIPMADGGEGTVESMIDAMNGALVRKEVMGPIYGKKVIANYGISGDGKTAVIEMAAASGLMLVSEEEKNPLNTTTYGTGELMKDALDKGVEKMIIGIGGSATNDGGAGMAMALGVRFLDDSQNELTFGGQELGKLAYLDLEKLDSRLKSVSILVASDVTNPLTGENGASRVFGPQKGATEEIVLELEENLKNYGRVLNKELDLPEDALTFPGGGAAGGLGIGLIAFTGAKLKRGVDIVIDSNNLESFIKNADYVFTGEGGIDFQTKFWKTPFGVASMAKKYQVPVISFSGYVGDDIEELYEDGFTAIFGILDKACSMEEALANGIKNIERVSENVARLLQLNDKDYFQS